jgi:C4-type Zn-finger protein
MIESFIPYTHIVNTPERIMNDMINECQYIYFNNGTSIDILDGKYSKYLDINRIFPAIDILHFILYTAPYTNLSIEEWMNKLKPAKKSTITTVGNTIREIVDEINESLSETEKDEKKKKMYTVGKAADVYARRMIVDELGPF